MSYAVAESHPSQVPVIRLDADRRGAFVTRTYSHLFAAIAGFTGIEVLLFSSGVAETLARGMLSVSWLLILGAFMVVGWIASHVAARATSMPAQYAALAAFVAAEALIFVPLLYMAQVYAPGAIESAAVITLVAFAGLTIVAFSTRKDFSFLGGLLRWAFVLVLVAIVASVLFGWHLGTWFSLGMVALAGAAILYDTSNVLHHYPQDRHVGAALALFSSVALMFWYVLSLFLSRD